ncbi:hypothetical protein F6P73_04260 [Streptococcus suis]|nr:hypothetical protein [Streptococcus suis]RRN53429.1 hypothetical protein EI218_07085 [Streptococcus suis]
MCVLVPIIPNFLGKRERERTSNVNERVRFPAPAQLIRLDLECKTRTNLPINHCAEMLTLTL